MTRILVTGGAGFIGSHIVEELVTRGHSVRVLDSLVEQVHGPAADRPAYLHPATEFIRGDVPDTALLRRALDGVEVVFHEAAEVGVGQSMYEVTRYVGGNTYATAVLLEVLANEKHAVRRLIVASSMSIYGEGAYQCPRHGRSGFDRCGRGRYLYYQDQTNDYASWAYMWTLIPGFVGVGTILAGLLGENTRRNLAGGLRMIVISAVMFLVFATFLGDIDILGDYGAAILLILLGVFVLARGIMRAT